MLKDIVQLITFVEKNTKIFISKYLELKLTPLIFYYNKNITLFYDLVDINSVCKYLIKYKIDKSINLVSGNILPYIEFNSILIIDSRDLIEYKYNLIETFLSNCKLIILNESLNNSEIKKILEILDFKLYKNNIYYLTNKFKNLYINFEFKKDVKNIKPPEPFMFYIKELLSLFVEKDDINFLSKYEDNWIKAFTHKSHNQKNNYEAYEKLGDMTMSYGFHNYLYKWKNNISEQELTNAKINHLSSYYQSWLGKELGMHNWIIANKTIDDDMIEDVLEAFFGCIDSIIIENKEELIGYGSKIAYNFFKYFFTHNKIDLKEPPKNYINKLLGNTVIEEFTDYVFYKEIKLSLKPEAYKILNTKNLYLKIPDSNILIIEIKGDNKKNISWEAYKKLREYIEKLGYTEEYEAKLQLKEKFENINYKKAFGKALLTNRNIKELQINKIEDNDSKIVEVWGITDDDNILLFRKKFSSSVSLNNNLILLEYLKL